MPILPVFQLLTYSMPREQNLSPEKRAQWEENQRRYRAVLESLEMTQLRSAELLTALSGGRPVAVRTVRSWLNNIDGPTASYLPDWAVEMLENYAKERVRGRAKA